MTGNVESWPCQQPHLSASVLKGKCGVTFSSGEIII